MKARSAGDVLVCEVGPRDGLQNEAHGLSVAERVHLIERLAACGIRRIEAVSFVNPRRVPQMGNAEEVISSVQRRPGTSYAGLVLNERGAERAVNARVDTMHFAMAATEAFNERNQNASLASSVRDFERIAVRARRANLPVVAVIGVAFGCPFEGPVMFDQVVSLASQLASSGAQEIVLADTIGVAVPTQVRDLVRAVRSELGPELGLGCHFHNTRNTGLANAYAAIDAGVTVLDASVGGIGGCPFAPRATGNIPSEDLVYMLEGMGVHTGIDISALIETAIWLEGMLGQSLPGLVMKAGPFDASKLAPAR